LLTALIYLIFFAYLLIRRQQWT